MLFRSVSQSRYEVEKRKQDIRSSRWAEELGDAKGGLLKYLKDTFRNVNGRVDKMMKEDKDWTEKKFKSFESKPLQIKP